MTLYDRLIKSKVPLLTRINSLETHKKLLIQSGTLCRHALQRIAEIPELRSVFPGAQSLVEQWDETIKEISE